MNGWLGCNQGELFGGGRHQAYNISEIKHPSRVFFFSEQNPFPTEFSTPIGDHCLIYRHIASGAHTDGFATFHNAPGGDLTAGEANMVFVDGHIESLHFGVENVDEGCGVGWAK